MDGEGVRRDALRRRDGGTETGKEGGRDEGKEGPTNRESEGVIEKPRT